MVDVAHARPTLNGAPKTTMRWGLAITASNVEHRSAHSTLHSKVGRKDTTLPPKLTSFSAVVAMSDGLRSRLLAVDDFVPGTIVAASKPLLKVLWCVDEFAQPRIADISRPPRRSVWK